MNLGFLRVSDQRLFRTKSSCSKSLGKSPISIPASDREECPYTVSSLSAIPYTPVRLLVLGSEDVFCTFVRQKDVYKKFSLYGVSLCRDMSACECSFVPMGLHRITHGQIRVVVHCLTAAKGCKEITGWRGNE
jgi:hypothetical protein